MYKAKKVLCIVIISALLVSIFPTFAFANSGRESFERTLNDSEMRVIIGTGGGDDGSSDPDPEPDPDPYYTYDKDTDYSISYGTATLVFFRENQTSEPIYIGKR